MIVKADDVGVALAKNDRGSITGVIGHVFGRTPVLGMPGFLTFLGVAGTAAAKAAVRALPSAAGPVK